MDAPWWTGNDNAPGLDADDPYERPADFRCAQCGMPIERVSLSVYIPPFQQVLVACSETCKADLESELAE